MCPYVSIWVVMLFGPYVSLWGLISPCGSNASLWVLVCPDVFLYVLIGLNVSLWVRVTC